MRDHFWAPTKIRPFSRILTTKLSKTLGAVTDTVAACLFVYT